MLIKSLSHISKSASVGRLISYIFGVDKERFDKEGNEIIITKNLIGDRKKWEDQFARIENRRTSFYGGREVKFYHEILSWHPDSHPTKEETEDLIHTYLEYRTDSPTLAFAGVHFDKSHVHAHICLQGIDLYGKSIRKSKADFNLKVQQKLEAYQQKKYPHLSASIIDYSTGAKDRTRLESHRSYQRKQRTGEVGKKEELISLIEKVFVGSDSPEHFTAELLKVGVECYYRSGKLTGVYFGGRKWRLRHTLGVDFDQLLKPDLRTQRMRRLKAIKDEQQKSKER